MKQQSDAILDIRSGGITFALGVAAVYIGKAIGCKLADKAGLLGGVVLIGIGVKLLVEGLM